MITIRFDDYGANMEMENEGRKSFKYLSMPKFQQLVLQSYNFETGLLPLGTVAFKRTGSGEFAAIVRPGRVHEVRFELEKKEPAAKMEKFKIPVPPLLWIFRLNIDKVIQETRVFALKTLLVTEATTLFKAPFSNIFAGTGKVCWGDNEFVERPFRTLVGLSSLPEMFFSQPFNKDLENNNGGNTPGETETLKLFRKLNGKKEFPRKILKEFGKFKETWANED